MIKILIISRTPWDSRNSFGNTFTNIFLGMKNVELYNICCQAGVMDSPLVKEAIQFTERSVLKSFLNSKCDPCLQMSLAKTADGTERIYKTKKRVPKNTFTYFCRDIIWSFGRWKKSQKLQKFLMRIKPDVIYVPIYSSIYMCNFQNFIINKLNVPVVGHISDDVFFYQKGLTALANLYRFKLRKKIKKLIDRCSYLEVFAENMKVAYEPIFNKKCYLIGKGIDTESIELTPIDKANIVDKPIRFLYTGNIGCERYKVLCDIAKAIDNCSDNSNNVTLEIYSSTVLTKRMKKDFAKCKSLLFHGEADYQDIVKKQSEADLLIHVESFSNNAISATRMSFSTKIIDYMLAKKPILAVGPEEVNSIALLKDKNIAITITNKSLINKEIFDILSGKTDFIGYVQRSLEYVKEARDIKKIQSGILLRMENLIKNENSTNKCSL